MSICIQVSKDRFDKVLGILKHALERRVTLPILQYILLEIYQHEIILKATDMEFAFEASVPISGYKGDSKVLAVPGKKIIETIKAYPDGLITLEWLESSHRLWLRANGFNSEHNTQPGECFPELPRLKQGLSSINLPINVFRKAIALGAISASKDNTKPALSGILLHMCDSFLRVVSTDGFRLSVVEMPCNIDPLNVDTKLIVPRKVLDIIPSSASDSDELILSWDDRSIFICQQGLQFSTRRVNSNYPAYERILPDELPKKVIMDREDFLKTLRVVGLKKDDYNRNVRLFFEFPNLRVFFQHPDEGVNQGIIGFSGEEQPLELAFNIDYLTELLEKLPGDEVVYNFTDSIGQGIFMSPNIEQMTFRYILMPVKFANH